MHWTHSSYRNQRTGGNYCALLMTPGLRPTGASELTKRPGTCSARRPKNRAAPTVTRHWTCPKCGRQFANKNNYHSCHRFRLADCFVDKPPQIQNYFDRLRKLIESRGPVKLIPYRDRIGFMVRVRFDGATPRQKWLDVGCWLTKRLDSQRINKKLLILTNSIRSFWVGSVRRTRLAASSISGDDCRIVLLRRSPGIVTGIVMAPRNECTIRCPS